MSPKDPARWLDYYEHTRDRPPHDTLARAMAAFGEAPAAGSAIDLGCGVGRDSIPLLRAGWRVLATDQMTEALTELQARTAELGLAERLTTRLTSFEALDALPPADLVNAGFSLPFCHPDAFPQLWSTVTAALRPGGRFSGHLLGPRDDWAKRGGITILSREKAVGLFDGFAVEFLREEEDEGTMARGKTKRWHIFHIVARRLPEGETGTEPAA